MLNKRFFLHYIYIFKEKLKMSWCAIKHTEWVESLFRSYLITKLQLFNFLMRLEGHTNGTETYV